MGWQRYLDIILYRTYAELKAEAQLSYMGYLWWILEPIMNTLLFYLILTALLDRPTSGAFAFIIVGAIIWQWLNASVLTAANSVVEAGDMLKQIYLPKAVLPLISILTSTWKFLFVFLLLIVSVALAGHPPTMAYLTLPLLLALEFAVIVGITLPLAFTMPYFPDARIAVDAFLRSAMLISGIFFPASQIPAPYRLYFHLNPMADLIEAFRAVLIDGQWPNGVLMTYVTLLAAAGWLVTVGLHLRLDRSLVKAIHR